MTKSIKIISATLVLTLLIVGLCSCVFNKAELGPDMSECSFELSINNKKIDSLLFSDLTSLGFTFEDEGTQEKITNNQYIIENIKMMIDNGGCVADIYNCNIAERGIKNVKLPKKSTYAIKRILFTKDLIGENVMSINGLTFGSTKQDITATLGDNYNTLNVVSDITEFP